MTQTQKFRCIGFVLCFLLLCPLIPNRLVAVDESRDTPKAEEFLRETPNTLDGVFLGSSYVYSFWEPPVGWEDYGISVYSYACSSLPFAGVEYLLDECRKTQPDALYIIEFKTLLAYITADSLQYTFDYIPASMNKLQAIHACAQYGGLTFDQEVELYFPLFKFHSNWESIYDNRDYTDIGLKGASNYPLFWDQVPLTEGLEPNLSQLNSKQYNALNSLLDYCDESGARVLFIATPSFVLSDAYLAMIGELSDIITQRGYDCLNCLDPDSGWALDPSTDYYNPGHPNINGALKFTDAFGQYLIDQYGFTDKRGQAGWESWDASVEQYSGILYEHVPWRYPQGPYDSPEDWSGHRDRGPSAG